MLQEMFLLIIFVTAISGKPAPEICFLPGQLKWTLLPKERYGDSLRGPGLNFPTFQLRGGHSTTVLSLPQRKVRHPYLGVRWCYDVPSGRCYGTNDTRKRIKLVLVIYRGFMQGLCYQILRGGKI